LVMHPVSMIAAADLDDRSGMNGRRSVQPTPYLARMPSSPPVLAKTGGATLHCWTRPALFYR
jgi:hypothetical protein